MNEYNSVNTRDSKDRVEPKLEEEWIDKFKEKWGYESGIRQDYGFTMHEIEDFIRQILAQQKDKLLQEIIKDYGNFNDGCGCCMGTTLKDELAKVIHLPIA